MAARKFRHLGLKVEMWETSFRIEGMPEPIQVLNITEEKVRSLLSAVHDLLKSRAKKDAVDQVVENLRKKLMEGP